MRELTVTGPCHRASVLLLDFVPEGALQIDLLGDIEPQQLARSQRRLHAFDTIAKQYGKHTISYAAEKLSDRWQPKREQCSPRYTTNWDELPLAQISPP